MTSEELQPPATTTPRTVKPWMLAAAAALVIAVGIAIFLLLSGGNRPLAVTFELRDFDNGVSCDGGTGGYSDVGPGMEVVVRNNDDKVIGTSSLQPGGDPTTVSGLTIACAWKAVIDDLPADEDYYKISVGRRGEQVYSHDQLDEKDWKVALVLGGA